MTFEERAALVTSLLEQLVGDQLAAHHPGAEYMLDVFDSQNGGPDWGQPLAVILSVPKLKIEGAYGLCDAARGSVEQVAAFLFDQLLDECGAGLRAGGAP